MSSTRKNLRNLIKLLADHTNRQPSTISRKCTGSGATYERLAAINEDGTYKFRISTDRVERAELWLHSHWPADLQWPKGVARPTMKTSRPRSAA